jgi:hypothetical protein
MTRPPTEVAYSLVVKEIGFARSVACLLAGGSFAVGHATHHHAAAILNEFPVPAAITIRPGDKSDAAKEARRLTSYGDLDGLIFIVRIGVEPAQNGYKAKNRLDRVITPDEKAWRPVMQDPKPAASRAAAAPSSTPARIERPTWSKD